MRKLSRYIRPHMWYILLTLLIKCAATATELLIPRIMEIILDETVPAVRISADMRMIYILGISMLLCAAIAMGTNILANRMASFSSGWITQKVRHDLFEKLEALSARQMDELTISSAVSRLTSDTYNVNQFLTRIQRMGIRAPILLVGGVFMMLSMDWRLSLVMIGMLPVISLTVLWVTKKTVPLHTKAQQIQDNMVRICQENISGIRVIKALSKTEHEKQRFEQVNDAHTETTKKAGTYSNISSPVANLALNLSLTLVVVVGAYRVNSGGIEPGVIVAFLQYFTMLLMATLGITRLFIMWAQGEASAARIADVLALPNDLQTEPEAEPVDRPSHIEFRNVTFSYTGIGTNLKDLSFRLERGQTLGILGPTGAGKTTIINLLMRFYDVDGGKILVDGHDIRNVTRDSLRKAYTMVLQDTWLFHGTIFENIAYGKPDATMEEVVAAAKAAHIRSYISRLPQGYHTVLSDNGTSISKGQKQMLTIARAMLLDAHMLILDEATSNVDTRTEHHIQAAMRNLMKGKTCFVIAHRLSTIQFADHILVLDKGQVAEQGTHETLMAQKGLYYNLYQSQFDAVS